MTTSASSPRAPFNPHPKPLTRAIRGIIAGSMAFGFGLSPAAANPALPIGENPTTHQLLDPTLSPGQTLTLPTLSGSASEILNGHTLNIDPGNNAIINWHSFDIGKGYTVDFHQTSTASIVLNDIGDANASTIFGTLHANGQVYLVNQDGFIFEPGSSVNVNTLVATTLGISQSALQTGIGNVFNAAYQASPGTVISQGAALVSASGQYLQDKDGNYILDASGHKIEISLAPISVAKDANIQTNANGGIILLAASSINNQGAITANAGQVILAAAKDKVYLQDSTDSSVRGLLVEVGVGGQINNSGAVYAKSGNISMIGFAVNQDGIVSASTSTQLAGQVRLQAQEGLQNPTNTNGLLKGAATTRSKDYGDTLGQSATLNLRSGSFTGVTLDNSSGLALAVQSQPKSDIELDGHQINIESGALVQAHSGIVNVNAQDNPASPTQRGDARVYLANGAKIDVSGVKNVIASVRNNIVQVKLQSNELRDSPTQRTGVLYGKTVSVDIRDATITTDSSGDLIASVPIADISYPVQALKNDVEARSTAGGNINLTSTGDVIAAAGSILDVSGGSIAYQGADISTTYLQSNGQLYNLGTASPNLVYTALVNQTSFSPSYIQGFAAGAVSISSYNALLDASIHGQAENGAYQRTASDRAAGGELTIKLDYGNLSSDQAVVLGNGNSGLSIAENQAFPAAGTAGQPVALNLNSAMLSNSGLQNIIISTNNAPFTQTQNSVLRLPGAGDLQINASNTDINGQIINPSGTVELNNDATTLGKTALISVSGHWVNDWLALQNNQTPGLININGGKVTLKTEQGNLTLAPGSRISADAGAWLQASGAISDGSAGAISLTAAYANVILNGSLSAWGLQQDGSLSVNSAEIILADNLAQVNNAQSAAPLIFTDAFFQQSGFASYSLTSNNYGLTVEKNAQFNLLQQNLQLNADSQQTASGANLRAISQPVLLTADTRNPVNLSLGFAETQTQNRAQSLILGAGSFIGVEPGGKVSLSSDTSIYADGVISAPAGNISLTINVANNDLGYFANQGIWLGGASQLLAPGAVIDQPKINGLTSGVVKDGGTVNLTANRGYIVAESGSLIDVSARSANLDQLQTGANGNVGYTSTLVAGNGGSINLASGQGIIAGGAFKAAASSPNTLGGTLSVILDRSLLNEPSPQIAGGVFPDQLNPQLFSLLEISAGAPAVQLVEGANAPVADADKGFLGADAINAAGFGSISLKTDAQAYNGALTGAVQFNGDVSLAAERQIILDSPSIEAGSAAASVTLTAAYVELGSSKVNIAANNYLLANKAVAGNAQFTVAAQGVDLLGGVAFNGFDQVDLQSRGDVRMLGDSNTSNKNFLGELNLAGDLVIGAERIYPATLTNYTFNVSGSVTLQTTGQDNTQTPLSAGGGVTINARNIIQGGVLDAPFGSLNLNAAQNLQLTAGSVTSVSGLGAVVPFGVGEGGSQWLYPLSGSNNIVITAANLPQKSLSLSGQGIDLQTNATIDLNGGGELYAYEFIPGNGGSSDALNSATSYAILPGVDNILTPYDPTQYANSGLNSLGMGESVYLDGGAGLAAGWYTLLPAHYALLPGAFLVTPVAGTSGLLQNTETASGYTIEAGRYGVAGTAAANSLTQGFEVQPGSLFTGSLSESAAGVITSNTNSASPSQFTAYLADQFFSQSGAQLPRDAGGLTLAAAAGLNLNAALLANPASFGGLVGLGGQVNISGNNLTVVGSNSDLSALGSGVVGLVAGQLTKLNAPSLLLGGKRNGNAITITANTVTVASDVNGAQALTGNEILFTAVNQVNIAANAEIDTHSANKVAGETLTLSNNLGNGDGAILRLSNGGQDTIVRGAAIAGAEGTLNVAAGAALNASQSMLLDSSLNTVFDGSIQMDGGSLALTANRISLGDAPAGTPGLVLSALPEKLSDISLNSRGDLDLYGAASVNSKTIEISAAAINGFANAGLNVSLGVSGTTTGITLSNSGGAVSAHAGTGGGSLNLNANDITLGAGQYAITGFSQVNLEAKDAIGGQGSSQNASGDTVTASPGALSVAGNLTLTAAQLIGGAGATTSINAGNYDVTLAASGATAAATPGIGASWSISGGSISGTAQFNLPAGNLSLATGNGPINLQGGGVDLSGRIVNYTSTTYKAAPAGKLSLSAAQGDVTLAGGVNVELNGAVLNKQEVSNAGTLSVQAPAGQFVWDGSINASGGSTSLASGVTGGALQLTAANLGDVAALDQKIAAAGFTRQISLEQTAGDVQINTGTTLTAQQVQIAADQGAVILAGEINAGGASAGSVTLDGETGITLAAGSSILANALSGNNNGGSVTLDTVYKNSSGSGVLNLAGGTINVSASGTGEGGLAHLRTGRKDANDQINAVGFNTQIIGARAGGDALEATRIYNDINANTVNANIITAANITQWQTDTANFMNAAGYIDANGAALTLPAGLILSPGVEVRSDGDLTLKDAWDFESGGSGWNSNTFSWNSGWRYGDGDGDVAGFLTLSAAGDLNINASISDALATTPIPTDDILPASTDGNTLTLDQTSLFQDVIQAGFSWNYNLNAGGNVNLAADYQTLDPLGSGQTVTAQVVVRTGTGAIDVNAGNNIVFNKNLNNSDTSNNASAIYTVGTTAQYTINDLIAGNVPGMPPQPANQSLQDYIAGLDQTKLSQLLRYGLLDPTQFGLTNLFYAEYPTNGGNITLAAGGDIQGVQSGQAMTDWLVRTSGWDNGTANSANSEPTAWGINISGDMFNSASNNTLPNGDTVFGKDNRNFNQNVGALGGGNVSIQAGGSVNTLSVMIPATGKPMGVLTALANANANAAWSSNGTVVNGGGNLNITAGQNITGGEFYVAAGTGDLQAGEAINSYSATVAGNSQTVGVTLDLGDGTFNLQARQDIDVSSVMNPTLFSQATLPDYGQKNNDARFFTYTANSAVNLLSTAGNVQFLNNGATIAALDNLPLLNESGVEYDIYPGAVSAAAISGDIRIDKSMILYPSPQGNLQLLAYNTIGLNLAAGTSSIDISMSDADPSLLPGVADPAPSLDGDISSKSYLTRELLDPNSNGNQASMHALIPVHDCALQTQACSNQTPLIDALHGNLSFPASAEFTLWLPEAGDVIAGGNITNFSLQGQNLNASDVTLIQAGGSISYDTPINANGVILENNEAITLAGPGQLQVIAGGNINLGGSVGIQTVANLNNPALSATGASIQVLAGAGGTGSALDFNNFIAKYQSQYPELQGLSGLSSDQQRAQIYKFLQVLFKEISRSASLAAAAPQNKRYDLYQIGYQAIHALFPAKTKYSGDIDLVFSQIKTESGGDINLLTPGGSINVGLAGALAGVIKGASDLGIVAETTGNVNVLTNNDLNVNQSRVFTLGGGDITAWSSAGSIDAGKGAKSAVSAPAPVASVTPAGQILITYPPVISGSGIQAIGGGNVYLAAPVGVVNAGEAGISGNNIIIAATAVVGASNISASGATVGVPAAVVVPTVSGADSAAASAAKTATQTSSTDNTGNSASDAQSKNPVTLLSMDLLSFGGCSVSDIKENKKGCGG